jgi:hypothetical protein
MGYLTTGTKQWNQTITDWNLQNCEPKQIFPLYMLIILGICESEGKLTNTPSKEESIQTWLFQPECNQYFIIQLADPSRV